MNEALFKNQRPTYCKGSVVPEFGATGNSVAWQHVQANMDATSRVRCLSLREAVLKARRGTERLRLILSVLPEFEDNLLSMLRPFDIAKLLCATNHIVSDFSRAKHMNPIFDVLKYPDFVNALVDCGLRVHLVGEGLNYLRYRLEKPQEYIDRFGAYRHLGFTLLVHRDLRENESPMNRFLYLISSRDDKVKRLTLAMTQYVRQAVLEEDGITAMSMSSERERSFTPLFTDKHSLSHTILHYPRDDDFRRSFVQGSCEDISVPFGAGGGTSFLTYCLYDKNGLSEVFVASPWRIEPRVFERMHTVEDIAMLTKNIGINVQFAPEGPEDGIGYNLSYLLPVSEGHVKAWSLP